VRPVNALDECLICHKKRILKIHSDLNKLSGFIVEWFEKAESQYNKTCFYTGDILKVRADPLELLKKPELKAEMANFVGDPNLTEKSPKQILTDYDGKVRERITKDPKLMLKIPENIPERYEPIRNRLSEQIKAGRYLEFANNGCADGFVATSKNFRLIPQAAAPSKAIKSFINGHLTVCECEGMMKAVVFNAICELVGDEGFDVVFPNLYISGSGWDEEKRFLEEAMHKGFAVKKARFGGKSDIKMGDWTFVAHTTPSAEKFRECSNKNKIGAAASGWNVICVESGGAGKNKYPGFGLGNESKTLTDVKKTMIQECGGDPLDKGWDLYLHFRRRLNGGLVVAYVEEQLMKIPSKQGQRRLRGG
jgi:hypothetical protein